VTTSANTVGFFSKGNPSLGVPASVPTADWANGVQEELHSAITDSQQTPSQTDLNQLSKAIGILSKQRNFIINGDCRVAQRAAVAISASTFTYGQVDRILFAINGTITAGSVVQLPGASAGVSGYSASLSGFSGTSITSAYAQTRLEARDSIKLNGRVITVSCKVFQDTGSPLNITPFLAKPPTTADTWTSSPTTSQTGTTIQVPTGTLSTIQQTYTIGASEASLGIGPSLLFSLSGTYTTKNICVSDWQLEIGSVATPFEHRPYGQELRLCQRYYQQLGGISASDIVIGGYHIAGNTIPATLPLPVYMRANPTAAVVGTWTTSNSGQPTVICSSSKTTVLSVTITASGGGQTNTSGTSTYVTLTAEL
jgi:hypothetical protein